jgi:hypothetical protein
VSVFLARLQRGDDHFANDRPVGYGAGQFEQIFDGKINDAVVSAKAKVHTPLLGKDIVLEAYQIRRKF